jgi:hypothetical protein
VEQAPALPANTILGWNVIMPSAVMLNAIKPDWHNAECRYAECRGANPIWCQTEAGANPSVATFSCSTLGKAPGFTRKQ